MPARTLVPLILTVIVACGASSIAFAQSEKTDPRPAATPPPSRTIGEEQGRAKGAQCREPGRCGLCDCPEDTSVAVRRPSNVEEPVRANRATGK